MEKRIILEGCTMEELLKGVTESVRKAMNPPKEILISKNKAARSLGIDSRTLTRAMELCDVTTLTPSSIEYIRTNYRKNTRW